jgi:hypothetical protein
MKFEMSMDTIEIDVDMFSEAAFMPVMKKAMGEVLADHGLKMDAKQKPDGSSQKANSPAYAKRKANPGIRVGERLVRGEIPTILTGDMKRSRQVTTIGTNEVQGRFGNSEGGKVRGLIDKGYSIHWFSPKNIENVTALVAEELGAKTAKAIKVTKK